MLLEWQHLQKRGCLKSPVRENRTPGLVLSRVEGMCAGAVG
jgi:hypothetical protein